MVSYLRYELYILFNNGVISFENIYYFATLIESLHMAVFLLISYLFRIEMYIHSKHTEKISALFDNYIFLYHKHDRHNIFI